MLLRSAEVLILAGGVSRRMGSPKALLHFSSHETFLDRILAVYRAAGIERVTVVWAKMARYDPRILHYLSHPRYVSLKTRHEFHDDPEADRLASVFRGLRHADGASGIFLQDVDRPFVTKSVISAMLACHEKEGYSAPEIFGRAGHPLLLSPHLVTQLQCVPPIDSTLREILQPYPCTLVPIESMEGAALLDVNVNTPAEYRRYFPSVSAGKELVPA
ncbi:MAG TPA: nucleotidyltransferase family protein [Candidatus Kapabacteria bacterium]|nr:nucleotidyltransferase family protein [Candidatus Kapabacteria bacterium]